MADLTDRLFKYVQIDRTGKAAKARLTASKLMDTLISPLGLRLTAEEKKLNPGLAHAVSSISAERSANYSFIPFPMHELAENLHLTPPRKVNAYVATQKTLDAAAAAAAGPKPPKEKVKKEPGEKGKWGGNKNWNFGKSKDLKRQQQEEEGYYMNEDDAAMRDRGRGRGRGGDSDDEEDDEAMNRRERLTSDGNRISDLGAVEEIMSSAAMIVLPKNFHVIINGLFETFWMMEFEDATVSQAFFAKIDINNCHIYGLETFAEMSVSLSVIRDRLEATSNGYSKGLYHPYSSPEDFYSDFRTMFENIFAFYPPQSAPQLKAIELNTFFHEQWDIAKATFIY